MHILDLDTTGNINIYCAYGNLHDVSRRDVVITGTQEARPPWKELLRTGLFECRSGYAVDHHRAPEETDYFIVKVKPELHEEFDYTFLNIASKYKENMTLVIIDSEGTTFHATKCSLVGAEWDLADLYVYIRIDSIGKIS